MSVIPAAEAAHRLECARIAEECRTQALGSRGIETFRPEPFPERIWYAY